MIGQHAYNQPRGGKQPPNRDVDLLTACIAFIAMLLVTPLIVEHSIEFVRELADRAYDGDPTWSYLVPEAYKVAIWPTVFLMLKISLAAAVSAGAVALAYRVLI